VEADDLGEASVEEDNPATAKRFVALSAGIDQRLDDLKIDQSFVARLDQDAEGRAVVYASAGRLPPTSWRRCSRPPAPPRSPSPPGWRGCNEPTPPHRAGRGSAW
jgi:hypothetical protein